MKKIQSKFDTRQYMLSKDFEIFYYKDQNLSKVQKHSHDYYEIYFFMEGNVSMQVENTRYPLQYGDIMIIPPGTRHFAQIHDYQIPYRRFVLWISRDFYEHLLTISNDFAYVFDIATSNQCVHLSNNPIEFNATIAKLYHLIEEIHSFRFGKDIQISLDIESLLLHLNRLAHERNEPRSTDSDHPVYEILVDYIDEHISSPLSLEILSSYFHLNKYYLSHMFKDYLGVSVHQYILKKRLELCREALRDNTNISELCMLYGFNDYSVFYRAFKKEYGISPKAYIHSKYNK